MQTFTSIDVGIREIRQLTGFIKEIHGVDFNNYALTSFKRRVENFLLVHKYSMDMLLKKIEFADFFDHFVGQIVVEVTEMFRDPSTWILMKNVYLPNILKENAKARIWLPLCSSGEELYSLAVLLKESGWMDRVEVNVSGISDETLATIQNGYMKNDKLDTGIKNYSSFQGTGQLTDYFKKKDQYLEFDTSLFAHTIFFKEGLDFMHELPPMHLILFRNQMIYFNPTLQYKVCDALYDHLAERGLLFLGILEEIETTIVHKYVVLNKEESIYQRKN